MLWMKSHSYDRLEWDFIHNTLIRHNLDKHTCNLLMSCITSVSSSILVNSKPTYPFLLSRGIRQGDPKSPYIFILCMKYFTSIINETCLDLSWTPFTFDKSKLSVSHMLFEDDILFFGEANIKTVDAMAHFLDMFHSLSGLQMNPQKSLVYFSMNTDYWIRDLISTRLQIHPAWTYAYTYVSLSLIKGPLHTSLVTSCKRFKLSLPLGRLNTSLKLGEQP